MRLDTNRCATILAECSFTKPGIVAKRWGITVRSIQKYQDREEADPEFAEVVSKKRALLESEWKDVAIRFLRTGLAKLEELVEKAKPEPGIIREVAGAIKVVGDLQIVRTALNGEQPRTNPEGQEAPGSSRRPREDQESGVH